jgi:hypothetical protein
MRSWLQSSDLSSQEIGTDVESVLLALASHDWLAERQVFDQLEGAGSDCCPAGIGLVRDDGQILHICPDQGSALVHHHRTIRLLGFLWRRQVTRTETAVPVGELPGLIRTFFAGGDIPMASVPPPVYPSGQVFRTTATMIDPVLGTLRNDPHAEGSLLGELSHAGQPVSLRIDPDGAGLESCLGLARRLMASLAEVEGKALAVAADRLLPTYNESWRSFQRALPDGSMEDVEHPVLSPDEFRTRLQLKEVAVTGDMVELWFDDDHLFAGHGIFVSSFDGLDFADADATLFG